jgi:hypothetical protein
MDNNFLDDNWLKQELTEEPIENNNFSEIVFKNIQRYQRQQKLINFSLLAGFIVVISYFIISLFYSLSLAVNNYSLLSMTSNEALSLGATVTLLFLIWSLEELEL